MHVHALMHAVGKHIIHNYYATIHDCACLSNSTIPQTASLVPRLLSLSLSFSQELTYMQMRGRDVYRGLKREGEREPGQAQSCAWPIWLWFTMNIIMWS